MSDIKDKNADIIKRIQSGDKSAEQELCRRNYPYVRKRAKELLKAAGSTLDLEDLIQEGMIGLLLAAKRTDLSYDNTFLTYAGWYVTQHMIRPNTWQGHLIRIPDNILQTVNKLAKLDAEYCYLSMTERKRVIAGKLDCSVERVTYLYHVSEFIHYSSLDKPIDEENEAKLGEVIMYPSVPDFVDEIIRAYLSKDLDKVLAVLSPKEQDILKRRCGYYTDGKPETIESIGKDYGVTRERIRQIEARALRKLRRPSVIRLIKDYK